MLQMGSVGRVVVSSSRGSISSTECALGLVGSGFCYCHRHSCIAMHKAEIVD